MMIVLWLAGFLLYIAVGVLWAIYLWTQFVSQELRYYEAQRDWFLRSYNVVGASREIPDFLKFEWRQVVEADARLTNIPPNAQDYQDRFALNIVVWPLSVANLIVQFVYSKTIRRAVNVYTTSLNAKVDQVRKDLK